MRADSEGDTSDAYYEWDDPILPRLVSLIVSLVGVIFFGFGSIYYFLFFKTIYLVIAAAGSVMMAGGGYFYAGRQAVHDSEYPPQPDEYKGD